RPIDDNESVQRYSFRNTRSDPQSRRSEIGCLPHQRPKRKQCENRKTDSSTLIRKCQISTKSRPKRLFSLAHIRGFFATAKALANAGGALRFRLRIYLWPPVGILVNFAANY